MSATRNNSDRSENMLKILISIECDACDRPLASIVSCHESDPLSWQADAQSLRAYARAKGWDVGSKMRCPDCGSFAGGQDTDVACPGPQDFCGSLITWSNSRTGSVGMMRPATRHSVKYFNQTVLE